MSNPFLKAKQPVNTSTQLAPVSNPMGMKVPSSNGLSAPPTGFPSATPSYTPSAMNNRNPPPPPTMGAVMQQMSNMNLNNPLHTAVAPPPPTGSPSTSTYNSSKGRYQVPSNAYIYGTAASTDGNQSTYYTAESGSTTSTATPAYIGTANNFDSSAPAPAATDPCCQPDEEYMKLTYEIAPNSSSLDSMSGMPFGAIFRPMAVDGGDIPVISFGSIGVQRCKRCRLYVNPFIQFIDGGRRWKCNMCGYINDVPSEYFSQLDMNGKRIDTASRPELLKGQVEFEAGPEYCLRPPQFPTYIFVIDVSYQAVASGLLSTVCSSIEHSLDALIASCGSNTINCSFITYDSAVHFYQIRNDKTPRQIIVSEVDEVFLPLPSSLLVNLTDCRHSVDSFLVSLPSIHTATKNVDTCLGNALQFAGKLLEDCGGKIMVFQASLPSAGVGKLKMREIANALGTDAEKDLLTPATPYYTELGRLLVEKQISVDVFICAGQYADVATLSSICQITGGQLFTYPSFTAESAQAEALFGDVFHVLSRETGFETVFRVRVPQGAKVSAFYGNFCLSNTDLMVVPVCHADLTCVLEFKLESVLAMPCFPIQGALLYTNSRGERRIRVLTMSIPISNVLGHLYERVNQDVITAVMLQRSIHDVTVVGPALVRQKIHQFSIMLIKRFKAQEQSYSNAGSIPDKLSLIPLYFMAMQKCGALRGGCDQKTDARSYILQQLQMCSLDILLRYLYPSLMILHDMPAEACSEVSDSDSISDDVRLYGTNNLILPPLVNLSINALTANGIYLMDDGLTLWLVLGSQVDPNQMTSLFGIPNLDGYDVSNLRLPLLQNVLSQKVHLLLSTLRQDRPYFCPLKIVRVSDADFLKLKWRLIEDRDVFPGSNYTYAEYVQLVVGGDRGY